MPDIAAFQRPRLKQLAVDLAGEQTELVYDANKVTKAWMDLRIAEALGEAVSEWNMTENGQPAPPTVETFDRLPYPALHALMRAVIDDATPGSEEGNGSSGPTSTPPSTPPLISSEQQPGLQPTPQNGTTTSPSPVSSASPSPT